MKKRYILSLMLPLLMAMESQAQVFSNKTVGKKHQASQDSLKKSTYPYMLPIWGQKATERGFTLPYSAGLGLNTLWQQSDLIINNLQVGFNNNPMHNLDGIVRFKDATATSVGLNVRPDVWLFPFLNVYGILAQSKSSTEIAADIVVPNGESETTITTINTKAEFQGTTMGFGLTPTMGVGGCWVAMDMNFTWTDIDALEKPAFIYVFGPRVGKSFALKKSERSIAIWAGGFRVKMNSGTSGSLPIGDLFNTDGIQGKIDNAYVNLEQAQTDLDTWWSGLTPVQQQIFQDQYDRANDLIGRATSLVNGFDNAVQNVENSSVQYSLSKRPKDMWNFLVGAQFQINRHWMIRGEYGFLGTRQQFIGGLQYRFGL